MTPIQALRRGASRRVELVPMNPLEQLRAGRLVHRVTQLMVGLVLFGVSMALLLRADLGLEPWGVLQYGLIQHIPMSYGAMSIVVSFVVLLLWIPLRQWPGLGTVLNAVVIGVAIDATLAVVPAVEGLGWRIAVMLLAIVGNGVAGRDVHRQPARPRPARRADDRPRPGAPAARSAWCAPRSRSPWWCSGSPSAASSGWARCSTRCSSARSCSSSCPMLTVRVERPAARGARPEPVVTEPAAG